MVFFHSRTNCHIFWLKKRQLHLPIRNQILQKGKWKVNNKDCREVRDHPPVRRYENACLIQSRKNQSPQTSNSEIWELELSLFQQNLSVKDRKSRNNTIFEQSKRLATITTPRGGMSTRADRAYRYLLLQWNPPGCPSYLSLRP